MKKTGKLRLDHFLPASRLRWSQQRSEHLHLTLHYIEAFLFRRQVSSAGMHQPASSSQAPRKQRSHRWIEPGIPTGSAA